MRLGGFHPVIVGAGVVTVARADEGEVLDAGDVGGIGAVQVTVRVGGGVELDKIPGGEHGVDQLRVLGVRAGAPVDGVRLGQLRNILHPAF